MKYQIIVHGSVFFETDDILLAEAYAHHTRTMWKNVSIKEVPNV